MAGKRLELVVDVLGTNPEDRTYAFEFDSFPEVAGGDAVVSGTVEYAAATAAAPALTLPPSTSVAGVVVGTQVQADYEASLACVGQSYFVSCTALTAGGKRLVVRGVLDVTGST